MTERSAPPAVHLPPELKSVFDHYLATMDIMSLKKALKEWPQYKFAAMVDRNSKQIVLFISDHSASLPVVLNLRPRLISTQPESESKKERIDFFLASRSPWLEWPL